MNITPIYWKKDLERPHNRRDNYHFSKETVWTKENTAIYDTTKLKRDICAIINREYDPTYPIIGPFKLISHEDSYCEKKGKELIAYVYKGRKCKKCGTSLLSALEFHHKYVHICDDEDNRTIRAKIKTKEIGKFARANVHDKTLWALLRELDVIDCLCGVCHGETDKNKINKVNEIKDYLLKLGLEDNEKPRCLRCGRITEFISLLEFHHRDPKFKKISISDICHMSENKKQFRLKNGSTLTIKDVYDELKKCDILCPNCHNNAHANLDKFYRLLIPIVKKAVEWIEKQEKLLNNPTQIRPIKEDCQTTRYDHPDKFVYVKDENAMFGKTKWSVRELRQQKHQTKTPHIDRRSIMEREREKRDRLIQKHIDKE